MRVLPLSLVLICFFLQVSAKLSIRENWSLFLPVEYSSSLRKLSHNQDLPSNTRNHSHSRRHHRRKHPKAASPSDTLSYPQGCEQITCPEYLTPTPIGSPCGCVFPIQVELILGVATFAVFPQVSELAKEIACGTYLKDSQVRITAAAASEEDIGRTVVKIDLVPLGEKFDNTTAFLTYERFWQKKVPINANLFGDYQVIYVNYSGLPSSLPPRSGEFPGTNSTGSDTPLDPITAIIPHRNKKTNARTIAVISLSACALSLVCFGAIFALLKCKKFQRPCESIDPASVAKRSYVKSNISSSMITSKSGSFISNLAPSSLSVKTFTLAELEKATGQFSPNKVLGRGGFGCVYHGIMEDGSEIAVKLLTRDSQNRDHDFIAEVEMLSRLHHRNLVKLIGICMEDYTRCFVYELVHNGSVESHLHGVDKDRKCLDWETRIKVALGAARGLAYLHEDSNPRVIHRDFKASNVLLEDDFTPKVSDFGLAREASEGSEHISTRVMGTFGYVAPEYAMTGHLLVKSDVYSYGVVLLELLTGRKPVDMSQPPGQENLVTWARPLLTDSGKLNDLVDPSLGENFNVNNMAKVAAIASMCVHLDVSQRPFMGEVVQALKLICTDTDETCGDSYSQREESSVLDCDSRGDVGPESSWSEGTPRRLTFSNISSFVTMDYCSDPFEEINRPFSTSNSDPLTRLSRSGPVRTIRKKLGLHRLRGSMSEHEFLSRRVDPYGHWV